MLSAWLFCLYLRAWINVIVIVIVIVIVSITALLLSCQVRPISNIGQITRLSTYVSRTAEQECV